MVKRKKVDSNRALFVQRLVAFMIDIMIVSMIVSVISYPFRDYEKVEKMEKESSQLMEKYMYSEIDMEDFISQYVDIYYQMARDNGFVSLLSIFVGICYYVVYQIYHKGQTIGKKLMKIRIVSDHGDLFMNQMIMRSFLANFVLINLISFLLMLFSSKYTYFYSSGILELIQYIIVFISIFMIVFRKDGCAVHDLLVQTKVVREK